MWPFLGRGLFPPPTEAWLRSVPSDPEAQGWGACSRSETTPVRAGGGRDDDDDDDDAGFLLSLLDVVGLGERPAPAQELDAIRRKLRAMERAQAWDEAGARPLGPTAGAEHEPPCAEPARGAWGSLGGAPPEARPSAGRPGPAATPERVLADHRSIYVGNVDYEGSAAELRAHFTACGEVHRVTILCDRFSGHPKGYAYVEFAGESSARAALGLDGSVFRRRAIKVLPKRTNFPGISSTDRGRPRGPAGRRQPLAHGGLPGGPRCRAQGRSRGRGRFSLWPSPY